MGWGGGSSEEPGATAISREDEAVVRCGTAELVAMGFSDEQVLRLLALLVLYRYFYSLVQRVRIVTPSEPPPPGALRAGAGDVCVC